MAANKRTAAGRAERLEALRHGWPDIEAAAAPTPSGARADDVLDALAGAWTARRVVAGTHLVLGGDVDSTGRPMTVTA